MKSSNREHAPGGCGDSVVKAGGAPDHHHVVPEGTVVVVGYQQIASVPLRLTGQAVGDVNKRFGLLTQATVFGTADSEVLVFPTEGKPLFLRVYATFTPREDRAYYVPSLSQDRKHGSDKGRNRSMRIKNRQNYIGKVRPIVNCKRQPRNKLLGKGKDNENGRCQGKRLTQWQQYK